MNFYQTYRDNMVKLYKSKNLKYSFILTEIHSSEEEVNGRKMFNITNISLMKKLLDVLLCLTKDKQYSLMKEQQRYLIPVIKNPNLNITDELYEAFGGNEELIMKCIGGLYFNMVEEFYQDIYKTIKENIDNGCDFNKLPNMIFEE